MQTLSIWEKWAKFEAKDPNLNIESAKISRGDSKRGKLAKFPKKLLRLGEKIEGVAHSSTTRAS